MSLSVITDRMFVCAASWTDSFLWAAADTTSSSQAETPSENSSVNRQNSVQTAQRQTNLTGFFRSEAPAVCEHLSQHKCLQTPRDCLRSPPADTSTHLRLHNKSPGCTQNRFFFKLPPWMFLFTDNRSQFTLSYLTSDQSLRALVKKLKSVTLTLTFDFWLFFFSYLNIILYTFSKFKWHNLKEM